MALRHQELLADIWRTQVPKSGQPMTVQGELVRAVAKLEDEATRNGNVNWDDGHADLIRFLRTKLLLEPGVLAADQAKLVAGDLGRVSDYEHPLTDDAVWDRLHDAVGDWCLAHPDLVPREPDPQLER